MKNEFVKILSYRPNISLKRKLSSNISNDDSMDELVNQFLESTPIQNHIKANNLLHRVEASLNNIELSYFDVEYNGSYLKKYLDEYNSNPNLEITTAPSFSDITCPMELECYALLNKEYDSINKFLKKYNKVNYGTEEIEVSDTLEKEDAAVQEIVAFMEKDINKINFASMLQETKLNKLIDVKLQTSIMYTDCLSSVISVSTDVDNVNVSENLNNALKFIYEPINESLRNSLNKYLGTSSYDNFTILYENICSKIIKMGEILDYTDVINTNYSLSISSDINNEILKYGDEIDFLISEGYKEILNSSIVLEDVVNNLNKKSEIKKVNKISQNI